MLRESSLLSSMHTKSYRICFAAGKSGGHIIPCLAQATAFKQENPATEILFFSTQSALDTRIIQLHDAVDYHVALPFHGITIQRWYHVITIPFQLMRSVAQCMRIFIRQRPNKVISTGGFIALPVCIAAYVLRIPIELQELNVTPGSAIAWLAPLATTVSVCFRRTMHALSNKRVELMHYPHRFSTAQLLAERSDELYTHYTLSPTRQTLLVLGGSQGSQRLNEYMTTLVERKLIDVHAIQIIHQTGSEESAHGIAALYATYGIPHYVVSFAHDIAAWYTLADLVICRAGAGNLFETAAFKKRSVIIPLELTGDMHQLLNAQEMVIENQRLFTMIRQKQISENPAILAHTINQALQENDFHHEGCHFTNREIAPGSSADR